MAQRPIPDSLQKPTGGSQFPKSRPGAAKMEARTSRYREVYARWQRDPHGFWAEAAQDID